MKAGPEGVCPTCARPLGAEYDKVLGLLDRQIEEVVSNGNYYKQRIEQLQQEPADLDEAGAPPRRGSSRSCRKPQRSSAGSTPRPRRRPRWEEQSRLRRRVGELESALDAAARRLRPGAARGGAAPRSGQLEPLALQAERFRAVAERRDALAAELDAAAARPRRRRRALTRAAGAGSRAWATARRAFRERARRQSRGERGRGARRSWRLVAARARARRGRRRRSPRSAGAGPSGPSASGRPGRAARELALHQELDRALTDLRTDLNATLRPDLSELASGFLRDLTNGRYTELELDEDYGATLLDDGDPKAVISGGEEDVANLALRLAISQMIAERAGQPLSLLILDEIFGSLDEDRRAARRRPAAQPGRPVPPGHPHHPHRVGAGGLRPRRPGRATIVASGVATVRDEPVGRARCGGLTGASAAPTAPPLADIDPLNRVFAEAFTDRYSRDGLVGVRVPQLNTLVWRYAIEDAGDGAMVWRDAEGQLVAFNMVHRSGTEGWMGPLAVRPDRQGEGLGSLDGARRHRLAHARRAPAPSGSRPCRAPWTTSGSTAGSAWCPGTSPSPWCTTCRARAGRGRRAAVRRRPAPGRAASRNAAA